MLKAKDVVLVTHTVGAESVTTLAIVDAIYKKGQFAKVHYYPYAGSTACFELYVAVDTPAVGTVKDTFMFRSIACDLPQQDPNCKFYVRQLAQAAHPLRKHVAHMQRKTITQCCTEGCYAVAA